ncbi:MAG: xanthine dehydrogenase family protein molybdopterin-binding subunit [Thermogemmatispora sp.]|uniref:xanthine dehydrogenase family protein molybdopterin-binding subunit n=1 Tax=Thermogemmatispora sp. TaxID=1968838 RepID=UPI00262F37AD|nr:xanthine dehydrogenase family protein molybdopterin-binding subunit [Thermogemmatispora sp.]MBX5455764.1 xanthine dehydrogenase family protein molybdopterin-binding subunit [Thermogemmatispora sp.]
MLHEAQRQASSVLIGTALPRQDGEAKVSGRARYAGDHLPAGVLHARLVTSPYAHAFIRRIDSGAALALPGVVAVFTAANLGLRPSDGSVRSLEPLASTEVCWCGHPVALVVAETEALAEDGAAAVEVDYEPLPAVLDPEAACRPDAPRACLQRDFRETLRQSHALFLPPGASLEEDGLSPNAAALPPLRMGKIEEGLQEAEVIVEEHYRTSPVHQSYLEPQTVLVVPDAHTQQLTIYSSTQGLLNARRAVALALGLAERQIHVEPVPVGGGFGGKEVLLEPLVAAAALQLHRPVRLVYTRQEELLAGNPAPQTAITVQLGARRDGTLTAIQVRLILDSGAYPYPLAGLSGFHFSNLYRCPHLAIHCYLVQTNKPGSAAYRAPTGPQAYFALESTVDELCRRLGLDPLAFRLRHALREGDARVLGGRWPRIGLVECLEAVGSHPLWSERERVRGELPAELSGWRVGIGLAAGGWPGATEPAAALCRLEGDGSVTVIVGSVDMSGSDSSLALIAAEILGLPARAVTVVHEGTDTMPYSGLTAGSKTTYALGSAVLAAAQDAREQILAIASELLEAAREDLELRDGRVTVRGVPDKYVTFQQVAANSTNFGARYAPVFGRGRSANATSGPMFAVHLAKVAVDPETGEVRVLDYVAAQDVGRALNRGEVEGQIYGGVAQGIGWALQERLVYGEEGQLLTGTLLDYALPHSQDVPSITPLIVEVPCELGPFGARGAGEPPVVPVAAAIGNALRDALGVRLTELPMTPERILRAWQEGRNRTSSAGS